MPSETYDGSTTALRRWSRRWKALAKSYRQRHVWNGEVIERQQRALEQAETSDGAMVLTLQLTEARQRIEELTAELDAKREEHAEERTLRISTQADLATERAAREQAEKKAAAADELVKSTEAMWATQVKRAEQAERTLENCRHLTSTSSQFARAEHAERERDEHKAAREQAEKQLELACASALRLSDERDTALARGRELEESVASAVEAREYAQRGWGAAEAALASARTALRDFYSEEHIDKLLASHPEAKP